MCRILNVFIQSYKKNPKNPQINEQDIHRKQDQIHKSRRDRQPQGIR